VHGEKEAQDALSAAHALFDGGADKNTIPTTEIALEEFDINIVELLERTGLITSRSEGRRLIEQGGVKVNSLKVLSNQQIITRNDLVDGQIILQKGKKIFHRVVINSGS
jgi:tyrosyl-tRNA synthetase